MVRVRIGIPSPSQSVVGMERCGHDRSGLTHLEATPREARGSHAVKDENADRPRPNSSHSRWLVTILEATDLPVAQTIEDQGEQLPGGGDFADRDPSPLTDSTLRRP